MRIKSRWHNKNRPKSLEETAQAIGFIVWRIAQGTVDKMYGDGFNFKSHEQQLDVIGELAIFLLQAADRLAYERMEDDERHRFVNGMARKLIETMDENRTEWLGPGEYRAPFLERLNERLGAYAEFSFVDGQPGYPALRYFGSCVAALMGSDNRWVIEQVMEVEAPEMLKGLKKGMNDLLAQQDAASEAPAD